MKRPGTGTVPGRFVFAPGRGEQPGGCRVMGGSRGGRGIRAIRGIRGIIDITGESEASALLERDQRNHDMAGGDRGI